MKILPKSWEKNECMLRMTQASQLQYTCGLPELTTLELLCLGREAVLPSSPQHVYELPITSVHSMRQGKTQHPFQPIFKHQKLNNSWKNTYADSNDLKLISLFKENLQVDKLEG